MGYQIDLWFFSDFICFFFANNCKKFKNLCSILSFNSPQMVIVFNFVSRTAMALMNECRFVYKQMCVKKVVGSHWSDTLAV